MYQLIICSPLDINVEFDICFEEDGDSFEILSVLRQEQPSSMGALYQEMDLAANDLKEYFQETAEDSFPRAARDNGDPIPVYYPETDKPVLWVKNDLIFKNESL